MGKEYKKSLIIILSLVLAYYLAVLLHEWGHGLLAWLLGYKASPFDVHYGGLFLLHADEHVFYDQILMMRQGVDAALIGIAGVSVSTILFILSLVLLGRIKQSKAPFSFFYWFAVINMVPVFQYFVIQTFSTTGDTGRFNYGLNIAPWWVFVFGTAFIFFTLWYFFKEVVPKAYVRIPVRTLWGRRLFLFTSLALMFLLIYTHGYNPLSDKGLPLLGKLLAVGSFLLVPFLFFLCNPSRKWIKQKLKRIQ